MRPHKLFTNSAFAAVALRQSDLFWQEGMLYSYHVSLRVTYWPQSKPPPYSSSALGSTPWIWLYLCSGQPGVSTSLWYKSWTFISTWYRDIKIYYRGAHTCKLLLKMTSSTRSNNPLKKSHCGNNKSALHPHREQCFGGCLCFWIRLCEKWLLSD